MNLFKKYINQNQNIQIRPAKKYSDNQRLVDCPAAYMIFDLKREQVEVAYDMLTPVQKLFARKPTNGWWHDLIASLPKDVENEVFSDLGIEINTNGLPSIPTDSNFHWRLYHYLLDEEDIYQIKKYEELNHLMDLYLPAFGMGCTLASNNLDFLPNHARLFKVDEIIPMIEKRFDEDIEIESATGRGAIKVAELGLSAEELAYQKKACVEGFLFAYEGVVYSHYSKHIYSCWGIV